MGGTTSEGVRGSSFRRHVLLAPAMAVLSVVAASAAAYGSAAAGNTHSVAIGGAGELVTWGDNVFGQLGDGSTAVDPPIGTLPAVVGPGSDWLQIAAGIGHHTCGIRSDQSLWCWGDNSGGQLGYDTDSDADAAHARFSTVVQEVGGKDWVAVAAGLAHTVALRADGSLWAWGANNQGQLGLDDFVDRGVPSRVGSAAWKAVAAGNDFSLAIGADGRLYGWGASGTGQVGDHTDSLPLSPVVVSPDTDWIQVAAGGSHGAARKSDGSLWLWGNNAAGQLGYDTTSDSDLSNEFLSVVPQRIGTDTDWVLVTLGFDSTLGMKRNGTLWACGSNEYGQLGYDTVADADPDHGTTSEILQQIGVAGPWSHADAGGYHMLAVKPDGTVWAWGFNIDGQLGRGTVSEVGTPDAVSGLNLTPPAPTDDGGGSSGGTCFLNLLQQADESADHDFVAPIGEGVLQGRLEKPALRFVEAGEAVPCASAP